jgi:hypothetical protein
VLYLAARAAEDAGDFAGASRLVAGLPDGRASRRWQSELSIAAALEPTDRVGLACWLVHPAMRWSERLPISAIFERHAGVMLKTMGVGPGHRLRRTAAVAASDPVVVDAGLFDTGLFNDYLAHLAGSPLLARVPEVGRWTAQSSLVWQVIEVSAEEVLVRDLWTERDVRVLRHVVAAPLVRGALVYGRVVPVDGDPGFAFVLAPERVDQRCARRLLRARRQGSGAEERLRAVGHSRRRSIQAGEQQV